MKIYFNGRYVVNISIVLLFLRIELNVSYFVLEFWGEVIKIFLYVEVFFGKFIEEYVGKRMKRCKEV